MKTINVETYEESRGRILSQIRDGIIARETLQSLIDFIDEMVYIIYGFRPTGARENVVVYIDKWKSDRGIE